MDPSHLQRILTYAELVPSQNLPLSCDNIREIRERN